MWIEPKRRNVKPTTLSNNENHRRVQAALVQAVPADQATGAQAALVADQAALDQAVVAVADQVAGNMWKISQEVMVYT